MERIFEPVYLNERMLLTAAAYSLGGYRLKESVETKGTKAGQGKIGTEASLLSKILSPISVSGEASINSESVSKSERSFTLGALHLQLVEEL